LLQKHFNGAYSLPCYSKVRAFYVYRAIAIAILYEPYMLRAQRELEFLRNNQICCEQMEFATFRVRLTVNFENFFFTKYPRTARIELFEPVSDLASLISLIILSRKFHLSRTNPSILESNSQKSRAQGLASLAVR
jgi:hypothetical protein